jgi:hypothetical protein
MARLPGFLLLLIALGMYFVPMMVALTRAHHKATAIVVWNVFLGWTWVGWVATLVWASTPRSQPEPPAPSRPCPSCADAMRGDAIPCCSCQRELAPLVAPLPQDVHEFTSAEAPYGAWLARHQAGFVVCYDQQRRLLALHRATCMASRSFLGTLSALSEETEPSERLACSTNREALRAWALRQGYQGQPASCTVCGWEGGVA